MTADNDLTATLEQIEKRLRNLERSEEAIVLTTLDALKEEAVADMDFDLASRYRDAADCLEPRVSRRKLREAAKSLAEEIEKAAPPPSVPAGGTTAMGEPHKTAYGWLYGILQNLSDWQAAHESHDHEGLSHRAIDSLQALLDQMEDLADWEASPAEPMTDAEIDSLVAVTTGSPPAEAEPGLASWHMMQQSAYPNPPWAIQGTEAQGPESSPCESLPLVSGAVPAVSGEPESTEEERRETIGVEGICLKRFDDVVTVSVQSNGVDVELMKYPGEGPIYHYTTAAGIRGKINASPSRSPSEPSQLMKNLADPDLCQCGVHLFGIEICQRCGTPNPNLPAPPPSGEPAGETPLSEATRASVMAGIEQARTGQLVDGPDVAADLAEIEAGEPLGVECYRDRELDEAINGAGETPPDRCSTCGETERSDEPSVCSNPWHLSDDWRAMHQNLNSVTVERDALLAELKDAREKMEELQGARDIGVRNGTHLLNELAAEAVSAMYGEIDRIRTERDDLSAEVARLTEERAKYARLIGVNRSDIRILRNQMDNLDESVARITEERDAARRELDRANSQLLSFDEAAEYLGWKWHGEKPRQFFMVAKFNDLRLEVSRLTEELAVAKASDEKKTASWQACARENVATELRLESELSAARKRAEEAEEQLAEMTEDRDEYKLAWTQADAARTKLYVESLKPPVPPPAGQPATQTCKPDLQVACQPNGDWDKRLEAVATAIFDFWNDTGDDARDDLLSILHLHFPAPAESVEGLDVHAWAKIACRLDEHIVCRKAGSSLWEIRDGRRAFYDSKREALVAWWWSYCHRRCPQVLPKYQPKKGEVG